MKPSGNSIINYLESQLTYWNSFNKIIIEGKGKEDKLLYPLLKKYLVENLEKSMLSRYKSMVMAEGIAIIGGTLFDCVRCVCVSETRPDG